MVRLVEDGQNKEQPLQTAMGNSYPVVIRLEALAEHAAAEGKQLSEVRSDLRLSMCVVRSNSCSQDHQLQPLLRSWFLVGGIGRACSSRRKAAAGGSGYMLLAAEHSC